MDYEKREKRLAETEESVQRARALFGTEQNCLLCKNPFVYQTNDDADWWDETVGLCRNLHIIAKQKEAGVGDTKVLREIKGLFAELSHAVMSHASMSLIAVSCDHCIVNAPWNDTHKRKGLARGRIDRARAQAH